MHGLRRGTLNARSVNGTSILCGVPRYAMVLSLKRPVLNMISSAWEFHCDDVELCADCIRGAIKEADMKALSLMAGGIFCKAARCLNS